MTYNASNIKEYNKNKVLIATHRGAAGGNIPCNTIAAFEAALRQGSDIIETDVIKSADGKFFIFHNGTEKTLLSMDIDIRELPAEEIKKLRLVNVDNNVTEYGIDTLDEALDYLKGRCLINLDRCWDFVPDVVEAVKKHNMTEQIILKSPPDIKVFKALESLDEKVAYMPIIKNNDDCSEILEKMNINYIGAELVFFTEDAPIIQEEYLERYKRNNKVLWGNGILYSYKVPLSAGHSDDISITGNPDEGWGWLVDKGFDIIQTDWPGMLRDYLNKINRR
ncbi:glycerophosphodiester phosphodiesterase family protein [Alloiococcus sp. CFN-8]|uniref:glycerophosphodiester phosphodiesterase family protein n=1 Tax=Alloiococcus sp. CFN-8 TaxID=3416081 RepID=UPI003CFB736C